MKRILFLHGKEGSRHGTKAKELKKSFDLVAPKLTNSFEDKDFKKDLQKVYSLMANNSFEVIIGSSRGGALVAAIQTKIPKILIAPAWKTFNVSPKMNHYDIILHSELDDIVPYDDSITLLEEYGGKQVINIGDDHKMSDKITLRSLRNLIKQY